MDVDPGTSNPPRTPILLASWLTLALHCLAWVSVLIVLRIQVPRFQALFDDFGVPMPGLTTAYLHLFGRIFQSPRTLVALLLTGAIVDAIAYHHFVRSGEHGSRRWWFWAVLLLPVGILILGVIAILLPLTTIAIDLELA